MDVQPGSTVKITVTSEIKTSRAKKTLARLFLKDPAIAKSRLDSPKPAPWHIRAGRRWYNREVGSDARAPKQGDSATILASVDTIRDLQSVEKYLTFG